MIPTQQIERLLAIGHILPYKTLDPERSLQPEEKPIPRQSRVKGEILRLLEKHKVLSRRELFKMVNAHQNTVSDCCLGLASVGTIIRHDYRQTENARAIYYSMPGYKPELSQTFTISSLEFETLKCLCRGWAFKTIAEQLGGTLSTRSNALTRVCKRSGMNRANLVKIARGCSTPKEFEAAIKNRGANNKQLVG